MATLGMSAAEREAVDKFKKDVVEPSMTKLVILDFWAEWCGPCKALTPLLEKVSADYADKGVVLAKVNVDENKLIAAQFQVRSIPTVYAMFQGQLVADMTPARTESQLTQMLDQILKQLPIESEAAQKQAELEPLIAMGEQSLEDGDVTRALSIFSQLVEIVPDHPAVLAGLVRALLLNGDVAGAQARFDAIAEDVRKDPALVQAGSAIKLAAVATPGVDTRALTARLEANPDDHEARFDLATALMGGGDRDGAADALLEIIARDRDWNEGAARQHFLTLLEATGLEDPWAGVQRRRLSAILFR